MKASDKPPADGPHEELFEDGGLSGEGHFKNGKRHGKWQFYYRNGKPKAIGKYVAGDLDGHWEWWRENGQPLQTGAFKIGKQVGPWRRTRASIWSPANRRVGRAVNGPPG